MRVLGISPFHDSSVSLVNDGVIEYYCKEERLSRKKRDFPPKLSLQKILNLNKKIDYIVICSPTFSDPLNAELETYLKNNFKTNILRMCYDHHLAHSSLAFYNSGFKKSLIFTIDRNGSHFNFLRESETVFTAEYPDVFKPIFKTYSFEDNSLTNLKKNNIIKQLKENNNCLIKINNFMNITKVYESATTLIGQNGLENGKTMGLSGWGTNKKFQKFFNKGVPDKNLFSLKNNIDKQVYFKKYFLNETNNVKKENYKFYADYAYQVQKQTQNEVLRIVKKYVKKTNIFNVCLTGGYALNVVTNEYLVKKLPNVNFYFEPLADDSGNSIGSAMYVYRNKTKDVKIYSLKNTFFHTQKYKINENFKKTTVEEICNEIVKQKSVAVFNENAEAGPRSLGNRSILFDARNPKAKEIINKIKKREWYRPFACSILKEYVNDYFETHNLKESNFMTLSFQSKTNKIPGVIHIDNSCRIQTVDKNIPHLYGLLKNFYNVTKIPVLLNTSFNLAGEAIVETPKDAIKTFYNSNLDILWFPENNSMLTK